jgi:hypothetical protein
MLETGSSLIPGTDARRGQATTLSLGGENANLSVRAD